MPTIRAVLFDAADTLFYNRRLAQHMSTLDEGDDPRLHLASLRRSISVVGGRGLWPEDSATHQQRLARWAQFYEMALAEAGLSPEQAKSLGHQFAEIVAEPSSYAIFDDVEPVLATLESLGKSFGIVSNFDDLLGPILDHIGLSARIPVVVTSLEVGVYKPDPRIFQTALGRLGVGPEFSMFVGDSPYSDIGGAKAAGMLPVLIDRVGEAGHCEAHRIAHLGEVAGFLG